jgi:hypothetical protein
MLLTTIVDLRVSVGLKLVQPGNLVWRLRDREPKLCTPALRIVRRCWFTAGQSATLLSFFSPRPERPAKDPTPEEHRPIMARHRTV